MPFVARRTTQRRAQRPTQNTPQSTTENNLERARPSWHVEPMAHGFMGPAHEECYYHKGEASCGRGPPETQFLTLGKHPLAAVDPLGSAQGAVPLGAKLEPKGVLGPPLSACLPACLLAQCSNAAMHHIMIHPGIIPHVNTFYHRPQS